MSSKIRYHVVLTKEGIAALINDRIIQTHLCDGRYFNCISVKQDGYFVNLLMKDRGIPELQIKPIPFDISIPLHFVLCIVSVHQEKTFGYDNRQPSPDKENGGNSHS